MKRRLAALLGLVSAAALDAYARPPNLPGPNPATAPIFAYVDSLNGDAQLESLRDAIPWIMRNGDEGALEVLESCLADSTLLVRDREWMIRLFTWGRSAPDSPLPCKIFNLLERLLEGNRLSARDWTVTLEWLPWLVSDWPDCVTPGSLDLLDRIIVAPGFGAWPEASRLAGEIMRCTSNPQLKARAEALLWQTLERLEDGDDGGRAIEVLSERLHRYYGELPEERPEAIDERLLDYAVRVVRAHAAAGEDAEGSAELLLSCLRARPDLGASVDWAGLHRALLEGRPLRTLHEGNAITAANLIPYYPRWVTAALVDSLFAALVERDTACLKRERNSYYGGIPDCIAACAAYSPDPGAAPAIAARLLAVAQAPDQAAAARPELAAALMTIYWRRPDLLVAERMVVLREAFRTNFSGMGSLNGFSCYEMIAGLLEIRPDLLVDEDLPAIWARVTWAGNLLHSSVQRPLLILARTGSDATYCRILANVAAHMESTTLRPEMMERLGEFRHQLLTIRRSPPDCD